MSVNAKKISTENISLEACYNAGYDAGKNGATIDNSHFKFFTTPERTKAWEKGKEAGANDIYKKASPKFKRKWNTTYQQHK